MKMDPNENLNQQRRIIAQLLDAQPDIPEAARLALQLARLVEALDGWLAMGGALPARWRQDRAR